MGETCDDGGISHRGYRGVNAGHVWRVPTMDRNPAGPPARCCILLRVLVYLDICGDNRRVAARTIEEHLIDVGRLLACDLSTGPTFPMTASIPLFTNRVT